MANFKKDKKYHYIYKTINLINNRYYLGMHSANNLNDDYLGSGKRLWYEIRKYGKQNFKLEILSYYNTREELIEAEKNLITENDINNTNCLNLVLGGSGFSTQSAILANNKRKEMWENDINWKTTYSRKLSISAKEARNNLNEEQRKIINENIKLGHKKINYNYATFKGKNHSEKTKQKMSEIKKGKGIGKNNSQYETCWITNDEISKKIHKNDLIPIGWRLGRKIK